MENIVSHHRSRVEEVRAEIEREERELLEIRTLISTLKERFIDNEPEHFSKKDIFKIFFGSLTIGFAFIFSAALIKTATSLDVLHLEIIIFSTFFIISAEIYFIWKNRVKDKTNRYFGEFLTKRLTTLYIIAIISSFILIYLFNIDKQLPNTTEIMKLVVLMSMPCSVGAAIPSFIKEY